VESANHYLLHRDDALALIGVQIRTLREQWDAVCREADLPTVDKSLLWRRQFLNPLAIEGLEEVLSDALVGL